MLSNINRIFEYAKNDLGWTQVNPARDLEVRKTKDEQKPRIEVPQKLHIELLLEVANPIQRLMIQFTSSTALRVGEVMATTWGNLKELDKNLLTVTHTINKENKRVPTKTEAGARPIIMADELVEMISKYKAAQEDNLGREVRDDEYLFTYGDSGKNWYHTLFYDKIVQPLLESANQYQQLYPNRYPPLPAKFKWKDFRHFAISMWLEMEFSDVVVWTMAGHANFASIERTYGHVIQNRSKFEQMNAAWEQTFGKGDSAPQEESSAA